MAISTSCCFNLSPRPPASSSTSSIPPNTTQVVALTRPKNENSWKNKCALGMACLIIDFESEGFIGNNQVHASIASNTKAVVESKRWSDKRICPPWQINSLETIVPENLPRPSAHRRWETVGLSKVAPVVKFSTATSGNCFSM